MAAPSMRVGVWLVVALVGAYGAYGLWVAATRDGVWSLAAAYGVLALAGAAALAAGKRWAQPLVHAVTASVAGGWLLAVWVIARQRAVELVELVPGFFLVLACAACSLVVFRHFRATR